MSQNDLAYYLQRAAFERKMALDAASPEIAAIHEELARAYDHRAKEPEPERVLRAVG